MIIDRRIDAGKAFDWGRTSEEYAKYRDVMSIRMNFIRGSQIEGFA